MKNVFLMLMVIVYAFSTEAQAQNGYEKSIELNGLIGVGDYKNNTIGAYMINGYRFNDYFFAGVGTGIGYSNMLSMVNIKDGKTSELRNESYLVPVFINMKFYFTTGGFQPFASINAGYTFDVEQYLKDAPGFVLEPGIGGNFNLEAKKSIYFLLGFNLQNSKYSYLKNVGSTDDDWEISNKSEMLKAVSMRLGFKF